MKKIAVLVSGGGTNLGRLIEAQAAGEIKSGRITLVISSKEGVFALERANAAGIHAVVLPRKNYSSRKHYSDAVLDAIEHAGIDIVVYAGFMVILSGAIMERYAGRMLNVHPSLLPAFGGEGMYGLKVHAAALERGVKLSGATVHIVTETCDGGPIILQKAVEVFADDTPETLQRRIMEQAEQVILPQAVELLCGELFPTRRV